MLHRNLFVRTCLVVATAFLAAGPRLATADSTRRVYDVADLLPTIPDFMDAPSLGAAEPRPRPEPVDWHPAEGATKEDRAKELATWLSLILQSDGARQPAVVAADGKTLIVTADAAAHALAARLLEKLRTDRLTQATIEARQLAFEAGLKGVDDPIVRELLALATSPDRPAVRLTEAQVNLLLRATQAGMKSVIITAPRITLFNRQRAYVLVATETAYVAGHDETKAKDGKLSFASRTETVQAGILLDARAAVDADRGTIAVDVRYEHARLLGMTEEKRSASDGTQLTVQVPTVDVARTQRTLTTASGETTLVYLGQAKPAPTVRAPLLGKQIGADVAGDMFLLVKATAVKREGGT